MTGSKNIYLKESYPRGETRGDYVNIYISNTDVCYERAGGGWSVERGMVKGIREKANLHFDIIISNPRNHG